MEMTLKYGSGHVRFLLPDTAGVDVLNARSVPVVSDLGKALRTALDAPIAHPPLESMPAPKSVAIAVPDETRPTPLKRILPLLLDRIFAAYPALAPSAVTIVVGGGLHPEPDAAQLGRILPEDLRGCAVATHDAERSPVTSFGVTSRGTPVLINSVFSGAQLKIVVGQIDPHQFVGFTGGAKGAVIGLGAKALIQHNHGLMDLPGAQVGEAQTNPVRLDLNEAGELAGIDLAVNVVLNPAKEVVGLVAGRPAETMFQGAKIAAQVYGLAFDEPYDIVVASCGGTPKDICLYQAQKGLNMASLCAREGGKILLLAECAQGVGDDVYLDYVRRFSTPCEQLKEFKEAGFRMGAHKSFLFSRTLTRNEVVIKSELDAETLAQCHLVKGELQETLDRWLASLGPAARIAVLPSANTTYFYRADSGRS
ncbi:MAG: nickel-dependent lactate racemase [Desulfovibrio sp.]|nr:nickel-dependent lactate racemase [Desulfovibrio sp.]MBI4958413.1 nickel-dependent lactate racemase [Desulfovibrio sp.]